MDILFPPLCHCCKAYIPGAGKLHICHRCLADIGGIASPLCSLCGIPFVTDGGDDHRCGDCIAEPPPFAAARAAGVYDGPLRALLHRFKYDHKVHLRRPLALFTAERLAPFVTEAAPDLIVPVPLHRKRLAGRAFNQAVLLGEVLAREWQVPLVRDELRRIRWTAPQVGLPATDRARNVRGAFAVRRTDAIRSRRILLVDDVYTTGSTVAECARTLTAAGAETVHVVTVARALL